MSDDFLKTVASIWDLDPPTRHRVIAEWDALHGRPHGNECPQCRRPNLATIKKAGGFSGRSFMYGIHVEPLSSDSTDPAESG